MNKESLNIIYNKLKDNLSIILLVPTLLGGLWQLLELSSISTSFIRFFSLTQLVADGILILFVLTLFYVSYKSIGITFKKETFISEYDNPKVIYFNIVLMILISLCFIYMIIPAFIKSYELKEIGLLGIVITIPGLTVLFGGFFFSLSSIIGILRRNKLLKNLILNKGIISLLNGFIVLFIVTLFFMLLNFYLIHLNPHISNIHKNIIFPDNLLNKEILDKKLIKEYHLKYKPVLIYNNDKYIFYAIFDEKGNEKILIVDFSELAYK